MLSQLRQQLLTERILGAKSRTSTMALLSVLFWCSTDGDECRRLHNNDDGVNEHLVEAAGIMVEIEIRKFLIIRHFR